MTQELDLLPGLASVGVMDKGLLCWVPSPSLLLVTEEQSGCKMKQTDGQAGGGAHNCGISCHLAMLWSVAHRQEAGLKNRNISPLADVHAQPPLQTVDWECASQKSSALSQVGNWMACMFLSSDPHLVVKYRPTH